MPEAAEVEVYRRDLSSRLLNSNLRNIWFSNQDLVLMVRRYQDLAKPLILVGITRKGKKLVISTNQFHLVLSFGLTGSVTLGSPSLHQDSDRMRLMMANNKSIIFRDPIGYGSIHIFKDLVDLDKFLGRLGPDILEQDLLAPSQRLVQSTEPVGELLLDQSYVSGIGNIYRSEACWLAQVDPRQPGNSLSLEEWSDVLYCARAIIAESVVFGGSSIRSYTNVDGVKGTHSSMHRAYKQEVCERCGDGIAEHEDSRKLYYCPTCQGVYSE